MYRAVIVDDEPFMLEGMRMMIDWQRCGFTLCGEACSAQDALQLIDTLQPHLLITDVRMPGMLGTDLAAIVSRYHPGTLILFFSGYRNFSYAQSAIRSHAFGYLVKPIDAQEVEGTLLKAKAELDARQAAARHAGGPVHVLRDQALGRLACGDGSPDNLLRAGALLNLHGDDPCYCAVFQRCHGTVSDNERLVLSSANAVLFELSPKEYGLAFRQIERDTAALEILRALFPNPDAFTLSAGGVYGGVRGFHKSLSEALDAQGVLYESSGSLRLYKPFDARTIAWIDRACLPALRDALTGGGEDALDTAVASLREAADGENPNLFALRCMAATLDAMLPVAPGDLRSPPDHPLWQQDASDAKQWLDAFCEQLRTLRRSLLPETENAFPAPVRAVTDAIRMRYRDPLSLQKIAGDLHMNPAYLGQLVKKHTGTTFHRQLFMVRIEHACLLLRQTASQVSEIALSVGFRDVDYFSQQFRNRMGMSPVAYRYAVTPKEDVHAPNQ